MGAPHVYNRAARHIDRHLFGGIVGGGYSDRRPALLLLGYSVGRSRAIVRAHAIHLWRHGDVYLGRTKGVMVAVAPFDFQAHDTYFVVGHLHYVLVGGTIFPILAGIAYFYPCIVGKQLSKRLGRTSFWLTFIGFNVAFMPMHWTGLLGMPRRVFTYPAGLGFEWLNMTSTVGAFILAAGLFVFMFDFLRPRRSQPYSLAIRGTQGRWNG